MRKINAILEKDWKNVNHKDHYEHMHTRRLSWSQFNHCSKKNWPYRKNKGNVLKIDGKLLYEIMSLRKNMHINRSLLIWLNFWLPIVWFTYVLCIWNCWIFGELSNVSKGQAIWKTNLLETPLPKKLTKYYKYFYPTF